ncbi:MAG: type I restriction enzyme HsdR N-terminal domain-containing protein [Chitinophagaceae bacterium]
MILLTYPEHEYRIRGGKGKEIIFDPIRKSWIRLTPEEWVRQNTIQYLLQVVKYPSTMIAVEKEIQLGELKKRFDLMVFDPDHHPWMIIECKSMDVAINQSVLEQVLRYNISVPVPFLVVTNGSSMAGFERRDNGLHEIQNLPVFHL